MPKEVDEGSQGCLARRVRTGESGTYRKVPTPSLDPPPRLSPEPARQTATPPASPRRRAALDWGYQSRRHAAAPCTGARPGSVTREGYTHATTHRRNGPIRPPVPPARPSPAARGRSWCDPRQTVPRSPPETGDHAASGSAPPSRGRAWSLPPDMGHRTQRRFNGHGSWRSRPR